MRFLRAGVGGRVSETWGSSQVPPLGSGEHHAGCSGFRLSIRPRLTPGFPPPPPLPPQEPGGAHPGGAVPPPRLLHLRRLRAEPEDARALLGGGRAVLREACPPAVLGAQSPRLPGLSTGWPGLRGPLCARAMPAASWHRRAMVGDRPLPSHWVRPEAGLSHPPRLLLDSLTPPCWAPLHQSPLRTLHQLAWCSRGQAGRSWGSISRRRGWGTG